MLERLSAATARLLLFHWAYRIIGENAGLQILIEHRSKISTAGTTARADSGSRTIEDFAECIAALRYRVLDLTSGDLIA